MRKNQNIITLTDLELEALITAFDNSVQDDDEIKNLYNSDTQLISAYHRVAHKLSVAEFALVKSNA